MNKRNVPLNALRAFELAARHLSFTIAAEELNVTQVAVSRQIKVLEEFLETPLFIRGTRSLSLTEDGKRLLAAIGDSFEAIYESVSAVSLRGKRNIVSIQAYTTFAQRWLIPRLSAFHRQHPNIEVRISASLQPVDFTTQNLHAAIRSGTGRFADCDCEQLMPVELIPVCSPKLLENGTLNSPEDLQSQTLLLSLARTGDWRSWLEKTGNAHIQGNRYMRFENSALCYEAAIEGIGIAIGMKAMVGQYLASGQLVAPFQETAKLDEGYYLVWPGNHPLRGSVAIFQQWLIEEAARDARNVSSMIPHG